jgi:hypothetical protein
MGLTKIKRIVNCLKKPWGESICDSYMLFVLDKQALFADN